MVKDGDECKDSSEKQYGNGDEESDVEVQFEEIRTTEGTFGGYN